jgi:CDP-glucose 4,6-dehydratase
MLYNNTTIFGTLNILRIIKKYSFVKSAIFFTSDKVYENNSYNNKFDENFKLNGDDPYSGSKAASEIVINSDKKDEIVKYIQQLIMVVQNMLIKLG